jgi:hypothetical protein
VRGIGEEKQVCSIDCTPEGTFLLIEDEDEANIRRAAFGMPEPSN